MVSVGMQSAGAGNRTRLQLLPTLIMYVYLLVLIRYIRLHSRVVCVNSMTLTELMHLF